MRDQYYVDRANATKTRLVLARERMVGFERQIEPLRVEADICQYAISGLEKELAWNLLIVSGLKGHVVEFPSEVTGPNPRRMVVSGSRMDGLDLVLTGKAYTSKGTLTKEDWWVPAESATDCGPPA